MINSKLVNRTYTISHTPADEMAAHIVKHTDEIVVPANTRPGSESQIANELENSKGNIEDKIRKKASTPSEAGETNYFWVEDLHNWCQYRIYSNTTEAEAQHGNMYLTSWYLNAWDGMNFVSISDNLTMTAKSDAATTWNSNIYDKYYEKIGNDYIIKDDNVISLVRGGNNGGDDFIEANLSPRLNMASIRLHNENKYGIMDKTGAASRYHRQASYQTTCRHFDYTCAPYIVIHKSYIDAVDNKPAATADYPTINIEESRIYDYYYVPFLYFYIWYYNCMYRGSNEEREYVKTYLGAINFGANWCRFTQTADDAGQTCNTPYWGDKAFRSNEIVCNWRVAFHGCWPNVVNKVFAHDKYHSDTDYMSFLDWGTNDKGVNQWFDGYATAMNYTNDKDPKYLHRYFLSGTNATNSGYSALHSESESGIEDKYRTNYLRVADANMAFSMPWKKNSDSKDLYFFPDYYPFDGYWALNDKDMDTYLCSIDYKGELKNSDTISEYNLSHFRCMTYQDAIHFLEGEPAKIYDYTLDEMSNIVQGKSKNVSAICWSGYNDKYCHGVIKPVTGETEVDNINEAFSDVQYHVTRTLSTDYVFSDGTKNVTTIGCPAVQRLPTGEVALGYYVGISAQGPVMPIASDDAEATKYINELCAKFFGTGDNKTLKDDWLRFTPVLQDKDDPTPIQPATASMLESNKIDNIQAAKSAASLSFSLVGNNIYTSNESFTNDSILNRW